MHVFKHLHNAGKTYQCVLKQTYNCTASDAKCPFRNNNSLQVCNVEKFSKALRLPIKSQHQALPLF